MEYIKVTLLHFIYFIPFLDIISLPYARFIKKERKKERKKGIHSRSVREDTEREREREKVVWWEGGEKIPST